MSIFGTIMGKIFGAAQAEAAPAAPAPAPAPAGTSDDTAPAADDTAPAADDATPAAAPAQSVDIAAVLDDLEQKSDEDLDWRKSIVDLMKLLHLDSSLSARKQLAQELNYSGDMDDSATMNVWLHKEVMAKLAANGGKVPADLH